MGIDLEREERRARRGMWAIFIALIVFILALWYTSRPARGEEAESAPTGRLAPLGDSNSDSAASAAGESRDEEVGVNVEPADIEKAVVALGRLKGKISRPLYEAFEYAIKELGVIVGRRTGKGEVELRPDSPIKRGEVVLVFTRFAKVIEEIIALLEQSDVSLAEAQRLQSEVNLLRDAEQGTTEEVRALQVKLGVLNAALAGKGKLDQFEGTLIEQASQSLAEMAELRRVVAILQADVRQHPQWAEADKRLKAAEAAISELSQVVDLNVKRFNEALGRITEQEELAARLLKQRYHELLAEAGGPGPEVVEDTVPAAEILEDLESHILVLEDLEFWADEIEKWRQTVVTKEELNRRLVELEQKIQHGRPMDAGGLAEWRATIEEWRTAHDEAWRIAQDEDAAWKQARELWEQGVETWRAEINEWRAKTDQRLDALEQRPATSGAPVTVVTMYTINFNDGVRVEETTGTTGATVEPHSHDRDYMGEPEPDEDRR